MDRRCRLINISCPVALGTNSVFLNKIWWNLTLYQIFWPYSMWHMNLIGQINDFNNIRELIMVNLPLSIILAVSRSWTMLCCLAGTKFKYTTTFLPSTSKSSYSCSYSYKGTAITVSICSKVQYIHGESNGNSGYS